MEKPQRVDDAGFCDALFSWSIQDVFNEQLYVDKVKKIPTEFNSVEEYFGAYKYPLLEEIRTGLHSSLKALSTAPYGEVIAFEEAKPPGTLHFNIRVDYWRNRVGHGNEPYRMLPGDVFILTKYKPETAAGLDSLGNSWAYAIVVSMKDSGYEEDGSFSAIFRVRVSEHVNFHVETWRSMCVVFLMNVTVDKRIWYALHRFRNLEVVKRLLSRNALGTMNCGFCACSDDSKLTAQCPLLLSSHLNASQSDAILACLRKINCHHQPSVELIWGPPGTGKTKTVATLLATLHGMSCRVLCCAPTNVAITALASCTVKIIRCSAENNHGTVIHSLGEILLYGNRDRLKVGCELEDIYLEYRVKRLTECFGFTGWRHRFTAVIHSLENCVSVYDVYLGKVKDRELNDENLLQSVECKSSDAIESFKSSTAQLEKCIYTMCTHIPMRFLGKNTFQNMVSLLGLLQRFEAMLMCQFLTPHSLKDLFSQAQPCTSMLSNNTVISSFNAQRLKCISALKELQVSLDKLDFPTLNSSSAISDFCFQNASLIFCTVAGSFKLHSVRMEHVDVMVIDEAAQLKECEAIIPLQLPGLRHAILIGDERQLPATVFSNITSEAGFGKSAFERLKMLGCPNHLLNTQYRMHPSISYFPNSNFYSSSISDAPIVKSKEYQKHYLRGEIFGSYSFINSFDGREERDDIKQSRINRVEVAMVETIINNLYKAWSSFKGVLSIGVISPYAAQVIAIQEKLACKYENIDGFEIKVSSIDGFQGSEKDVVILSTVRSNASGSVGFISSPRRTNVALTRARHCLWILGNGRTLSNSASVWTKVIGDAKSRNCFFNADENEDIAKAILEVKKELNQYDDLLNANSVLFRSALWRVLFTYDFKKSFRSLSSERMKNSVINLLLKLSGGWRPKKLNITMKCQISSQSLKQFKVENHFIICTVEIIKEAGYLQVLKFWNILPPEDVHKQVKRLEGIFSRYTDDYINHAKAKCLEGNLEIPRTWPASLNLVQFKAVRELGNELGGTTDDHDNVEKSKVSESLLSMKYYPLFPDAIKTLRSGVCREHGSPFILTEEEREILLFDKSTFILGRSGTGKTTILTMKMFRNEHQHYLMTQEMYGSRANVALAISEENTADANQPPVLRQLFVTASPKLCVAVKQHLAHLERFACGGKFITRRQSTDVIYADDATLFKGIPDSFIDIPSTAYPVVISFQKLLLMLDGTVGNSYFARFPILRKISNSMNSRSNALQSFIKMNQVTYDLFCSDYWPHFNSQFTKKLDSLRVYIEIMSHIKGGMQAMTGKLSLEEYLQLSESRASAVGKNEREMIFDIFQNYEKMKVRKSHFDLADLVNDLHWRLKSEKYQGDLMDFVYIDEVQDLTMRQLSLFKYICKNVDEGYVFSGDTAQTIAKVDFRFSDVRALFYDEFFSSSQSAGVRKKGRLSELFHLSQNFRTHAGILKLAHSVIDIVLRFFPKTIDVLPPEKSLMQGELPVLLESRQTQNALVTIFENSGNASEFGAEQVILVRDETVRREISKYVKKQALIMTIVECKGLAFQDVLLYNFFDSSPLKTQWGVVYEFMREQNLLEAASELAFPSFNEAKHSIMCSELKLLYVAITRARHRLWICENCEDFSKPMFDYWKKQGSVQVQVLNSSLAKEMQVASTTEEWKSRGFELLNENNFELATMCFTKSGDLYWQNIAKAAGLRAAAEQMLISNPEMGQRVLKEAAELFHAIGNADRAAECYSDMEEYTKLRKHFKQLKL